MNLRSASSSGGAAISSFQKVIMSKIKTKRRNLRQELAKKIYLDPTSDTFLNKSQTLQKIGYSESYAETKGQKILESSSITPSQLAKLDPFISQFPQLVENLQKKLDIIGTSKNITAKDYTVMLKHTELIAKCAGLIKQSFESKSINVNIDIPVSKCPKCGHVMDIMKD